jgi:Carboxypeptidase regulatory-like domain
MFRKIYAAIAVAVLTLVATSLAFGQAVSGNISGTIQDASGAVLPNVSITITDLDRGTVYRTQSNQNGNYEQTLLLAGHYQVKVESPGLAVFTGNATVEVNATTRVDATLTPANVATTVNVTDATPLLTTDRAEIATTLTGRQVEQLPVLDATSAI